VGFILRCRERSETPTGKYESYKAALDF